MNSSRMSEGVPSRCPLCAADAPAATAGDATCPACGVGIARAAELLARLQKLAQQHPGLEVVEVTADSPWPLGGDSLTSVEVMLALEHDLGVTISAREADRIYTVREAIRYFERRTR